jgi:hypothetical protein
MITDVVDRNEGLSQAGLGKFALGDGQQHTHCNQRPSWEGSPTIIYYYYYYRIIATIASYSLFNSFITPPARSQF